MVLIALPGVLRDLEGSLRVLHQLASLLTVFRIAGEPAFDLHGDLAPIDVERTGKHAGHVIVQGAELGLEVLRQGVHAYEGASTQVGQLFGIREVGFQTIRDALQQPIPGVAPQGVVDHAQVRKIEHRHRQARQALGAAGQEPAESLAEQRAFGQSRQRLEIGQVAHRLVLIEVLQRKGQVGGDLLEQQHLVLPDDGMIACAAKECSDRRVVDTQRQHRHGMHAGTDETVPALHHVRESGDVFAQHRAARCALRVP